MAGRQGRRQRATINAARLATERGSVGVTRAKELAFKGFLLFSVGIGIAMLVTLIVEAFIDGLPRLNLDLITDFPSALPDQAGIQSAIVGSAYLMVGVAAITLPLALGCAIYLEEYADKDRWWNKLIEVNIQNLAAVPSIVFGILGLAFIVRGPLSLGPVILAGSITLSMMVLPTVILASREAIRAVPDSIRQGALALGATKWQTIRHQVLPAAVPGVATGMILALSRAIGETAPLLLVGGVTFITFNPELTPQDWLGFDSQFTAIPLTIFNYLARPQEEFRTLAAAAIIVLLVLLLTMNSIAIYIRNRYRKRLEQN
ncbi:MAG TPA: phosphate ABC transporter permease PstA [Solirubrobacterales bacterium]|nr:phosphate ABC transporter permease PstA [Solirubrobacterales bacterium]